MHDSFDASTIIFAVLALVVLWKLRSVLGSRTGNEKPPFNPFQRSGRDARPGPPAGDGKIITLPGTAPNAFGATPPDAASQGAARWSSYAEPDSKVWKGLDAIAAAQPDFDAEHFLSGAKTAYEMIVVAFAAGDRQTLRSLLGQEVLDSFESAIAQHEAQGEKVETTVVSIDKAGIDDAQMRGTTAQIAVRFASKLISATRDRAGKIIEGSADGVVDMVDLWTFARDARSRDPNWKLVATGPGH
ncbi:MAG TPA: Tim44/TimA family putative adaptor protein [Beijerinckiaceae bacterium]|jgi:predicted lipid-binding transport protein (Tim44 family)|nr:Tim44/TimA family putative adaptor protein [Beijerinckiaceae bacterium]